MMFLAYLMSEKNINFAVVTMSYDLKICCMGAGYVGGPTMAVIGMFVFLWT